MAINRERFFSLEEKTELLPFPNTILQSTLFAHLANDIYTKAQLAKHPQFAQLPEYQGAISELEDQVRQLLWFVSHGKKNQAEKMLKLHPALLLCEGETTDYAGIKRCGTALQLAIRAEDVNLYDRTGTQLLGEGMAEMLHRYLWTLPSGEEESRKQINEVFPEDWEEKEEARQRSDLAALHKVRQLIRRSRHPEEDKAAVREFKKHLAFSEGIFDWNAKLLQAAFELSYKDNHGYDVRKNSVWFNEVIGSIESYAPANYAMAMAQGLKFLLKRGKAFKRDLQFHFGLGQYYPNPSLRGFRMGMNMWVDCYNGTALTRAGNAKLQARYLQCYIEAKALILQKQFMLQNSKHSKPSCCGIQ